MPDYAQTIKQPHWARPVQEPLPTLRLTLDQVVQKVTEVSTLPQVALQMAEVCRNPDAGAADLCQLVASDPALSSRVLRLVNSAAYALRHKISSLQRAISYVGFKQVRNLAFTASVSNVFKSSLPYGAYRRTGLWRHMVYVAVCSRMIATRRKMDCFEDAFLAGLLHDLGIILEDQYCHPFFVRLMENLPPDRPLAASEEQAFGFDHTVLGARVAEKWKFPEEVCAAIRFHHMSQNYRGQHADIVACVELANMICSLTGHTSVGVQLIAPAAHALQALGIDRTDLKVLVADLDDEVARQAFLLKIES